MRHTHNPGTGMALKSSTLWSLLNREFKRRKRKKAGSLPSAPGMKPLQIRGAHLVCFPGFGGSGGVRGRQGSQDRPQLPSGAAGPLWPCQQRLKSGCFAPRLAPGRSFWGAHPRASLGCVPSALSVDRLPPLPPRLLSAPPPVHVPQGSSSPSSVIQRQLSPYQNLLFRGVTFPKRCHCPKAQPCEAERGELFPHESPSLDPHPGPCSLRTVTGALSPRTWPPRLAPQQKGLRALCAFPASRLGDQSGFGCWLSFRCEQYVDKSILPAA